jgi:hypothetical protein
MPRACVQLMANFVPAMPVNGCNFLSLKSIFIIVSYASFKFNLYYVHFCYKYQSVNILWELIFNVDRMIVHPSFIQSNCSFWVCLIVLLLFFFVVLLFIVTTPIFLYGIKFVSARQLSR